MHGHRNLNLKIKFFTVFLCRNPDPSAVQFSNPPGQVPPRRRPPPSPQAQLQQLYFNRQFQQQIPLRPRILRPLPRPATPSVEDFPALTTSSQAQNVHEARLRASLAGNDPNLAVQTLSQQQGSLYDQQLLQLATAAQGRLVQAQPLPEQVAQVQYVPQQQTAYTTRSQVEYVPEPQQASENPISYSSRQVLPPRQIVPSENAKVARRPAPPEQYLRETTQPFPERTAVPNLQTQQNSEPILYLSSQSGQQTPSINQDNIISQLLSEGHSLLHSPSPSSAVLVEEGIRSSTSAPPAESTSSVYVTQTSALKNSQRPSRITVEEIGGVQEDSDTPLPVVHLPTPRGQRPLTQSEFQALIDAGFKISPVPDSSPQTVAPQYYQPTTKKQRSYTTPSPPHSNRLPYDPRQNKPEQESENEQQVGNVGAEILQQRSKASRQQEQDTNPRHEEEEVVEYIRRPESQNVRQGVQVAGIQFITNKPESEDQTIRYIQIPTGPQLPDTNEGVILAKYQPEAGRGLLRTQLQGLQDQRESVQHPVQNIRYRSQANKPNYQTEADNLPQQTPTYQGDEEALTQQAPVFHPIIVAELSTTPAPRRRRPRPNQSKVFNHAQSEDDQTRSEESPQQYIVSVDSIPQQTSFGTRNSRLRGRRPTSNAES